MSRPIASVMDELATNGTAVVPDVLDPAATAEVLERLWTAAGESERRGVSTRAETLDPNDANVRQWNHSAGLSAETQAACSPTLRYRLGLDAWQNVAYGRR